jgi:hypothetical protein
MLRVPGYVAILEDNAGRLAEMQACLPALVPGYPTVYFDDAAEMIAWLADHLGETVLVSLDHDLPLSIVRDGRTVDPGTGRQVADYLSALPPVCPVIVHTSNEHFAPGMVRVLLDGGWPVARVYPDADHTFVRRAWADQVRRWIASKLIFG